MTEMPSGTKPRANASISSQSLGGSATALLQVYICTVVCSQDWRYCIYTIATVDLAGTPNYFATCSGHLEWLSKEALKIDPNACGEGIA